VSLKYNKYYIGVVLNGTVKNFVSFVPKKQFVQMEFKILHSDELDKKASDAGLELRSYDRYWDRFRIAVTQNDLRERRDILLELIQLASDKLRK